MPRSYAIHLGVGHRPGRVGEVGGTVGCRVRFASRDAGRATLADAPGLDAGGVRRILLCGLGELVASDMPPMGRHL